ncbi:MAG: His-Xaa-Ser system radical SAM maturase HxsB [Nanoarchaeota archaeon]|nr:His-Xaa-Ser system radical SAM maturase HxsB [Nanoarchaeota archaeon]
MPSIEKKPLFEYRLNFFREKKFGEKILLVTFIGSFDVLTVDEYDRLHSHRLDAEEYARFEEKGIILTDDNEEKIISDYKENKRQIFSGTSLHIVVVTLRCNVNCIYCHAASHPEKEIQYDMSIETARKTVDFIFQTTSDSVTIEFQGGEPLLNYKVIEEVVNYANELNKTAKKDLKFSLVTNLSLMDDKKLDFLLKNKVGICTSLDGPKKLHDKNRPMAGSSSYDLAVKWIKNINSRKNANVNALMSTTRFSLPFAKEIIDEYVALGLHTIFLRQLNNLGTAAESWEKIACTHGEFLEFWKQAVDYVYEIKKIRENSSRVMLSKIVLLKNPMFLDLMSPCGAAIGQMAYNYNGDIYSCDEARMLNDDLFMLGTVHDNTYKEIMSSPKTCSLVASSVNETHFCDTCIYQPYCGLCPVCNYAVNGTTVPKLPIDFRCKVLTGQFDHLFEKIINEEGFKERVMKILKQKIKPIL